MVISHQHLGQLCVNNYQHPHSQCHSNWPNHSYHHSTNQSSSTSYHNPHSQQPHKSHLCNNNKSNRQLSDKNREDHQPMGNQLHQHRRHHQHGPWRYLWDPTLHQHRIPEAEGSQRLLKRGSPEMTSGPLQWPKQQWMPTWPPFPVTK